MNEFDWDAMARELLGDYEAPEPLDWNVAELSVKLAHTLRAIHEQATVAERNACRDIAQRVYREDTRVGISALDVAHRIAERGGVARSPLRIGSRAFILGGPLRGLEVMITALPDGRHPTTCRVAGADGYVHDVQTSQLGWTEDERVAVGLIVTLACDLELFDRRLTLHSETQLRIALDWLRRQRATGRPDRATDYGISEIEALLSARSESLKLTMRNDP